jgi:DNA-binding SARP family transcriptional activator
MRIRLFGDSSITLGGVPVTWVPTNFFRILAYLLLEESSQSISCSKLAQIFWSDSDQSHALINLRQSLARIRRFQDQYALNLIRADAMFVSLNLEQVEAGLVWIDALDLLKVFQDGDIKSVLEYSEECRGSLLAQYLPQQSDFDNWLDVKRAKLHEALASQR